MQSDNWRSTSSRFTDVVRNVFMVCFGAINCTVSFQVWKREVPGSAFVAIKSSAKLMATPQALFEVLTPGDIEIVRQVRGRNVLYCTVLCSRCRLFC